jgi:uncharacterized caspase-like protein
MLRSTEVRTLGLPPVHPTRTRTPGRDRWIFGLALFCFVGLGFGGLATEAEAAPTPARTALVIGNANYTQIPSLKNPVNDARDMAAKLRGLGFDVTSASDLDRRGMENAIRDFGRKIRSKKGDALFYYAGHGVERDGRNYLIPLRADIVDPEDLAYKAVDVGQLLGQLESAKNGVNIIVLDACRNNPYENFRGIAVSGLASITGPTGSLIAFSTSPGDVAADGKGRNGIFTKHLLAAMDQPGATLDETFQQVRRNVARETGRAQIPWSNSSVIGDFYFTEPGAATSSGQKTPLSQRRTEPTRVEQASSSSFEDKGRGQFLDTRTGLFWYCPTGRDVYSHKSAGAFAKKFGSPGAGWRLPTSTEFRRAIESGAADAMPGLQGDRLTRYWLEKKNIWLGEGEIAQITSDQQVKIQKKALTGSHKACFVRR